MGATDEVRIEAVRGRLAGERAERVMEFWARQGALTPEVAASRLREVVCVLTDAAGAVAGVSSAYADDVALIGGRRFWIYRSFLDPSLPPSAGDRMVAATFAALEEGFDPAGDEPVGLCLLIADRAELQRRPEAEWKDPRILFAGYLPDGRQVRIGYFAGAKVYRGIDG